MKIVDTLVDDPRRRGEYKNPRLYVEIDEDLRETGDAFCNEDPHSSAVFEVTPHGPFAMVDLLTPHGGSEYADLGVVNVLGFYKDKLVDVTVLTPKEEIDVAMGLNRARRLLRKHDLRWRYVLDDVAGQNGRLAWRLVEFTPRCIKCDSIADAEPFYRGTHLPMCTRHLSEHNKMIRRLRVNS